MRLDDFRLSFVGMIQPSVVVVRETPEENEEVEEIEEVSEEDSEEENTEVKSTDGDHKRCCSRRYIRRKNLSDSGIGHRRQRYQRIQNHS